MNNETYRSAYVQSDYFGHYESAEQWRKSAHSVILSLCNFRVWFFAMLVMVGMETLAVSILAVLAYLV